MLNNTRGRLFVLTAVAASFAVTACSKKASDTQSSAGTIDTATLRTTATTSAAGPGVHVTRTDDKSVTRAMRFELTPENFTTFLAAADSVVALAGRDAVSNNYLNADLTDAASTDNDAGLKWLESNALVSKAITSAGTTPRDYFIEGIAIADAQRFIGDPKAAPPTPTLQKNAEFLRGHTADLARLDAMRANKPAAVITP